MSNTPDEILAMFANYENQSIGGLYLNDKPKLNQSEANEAFYQLILKKLIGEDKDIVYGEGSEVVMNAILAQSNNKLRAEQRQALAKLFNKEIK